MKKTIKIYIAVASIIVLQQSLPNKVMAQSDSTKSVYNESVIVVGDYNPVLDGVTEKVNVAPTANENVSEVLKPKFTYSITPQRMSSLTPTTGIKAAKVIGSPTKLYNNYMRFGLGHDFYAFPDFNPLVDIYYTSMRNSDYSYGARLYHLTDVTTFGKENKNGAPSTIHYGRTRQSDTRFDIFGKYILNKQHMFSADISFDRDYGRYYGFTDSTLYDVLSMTRDSISFSDYAFAYNNIALNIGAKSLNTDVNKLGYDVNMGISDMWGRYDFSQKAINLDAGIHYGFPMFKQYKAIAYLRTNWQGFSQSFDTPSTINDMPLGYDTTMALPDTLHNGRHLLTLNPFVDFLFNGFKVHAGVEFGINRYDDTEKTKHNLFPDISVSKSFSNNSISITAGFHGEYKPNDWNSIRLVNPYVAPAPATKTTTDNNLYAHMRMNFSKKLILNLAIDNHFFKNFICFKPFETYSLHNVFTPYYVDYNSLMFAANFTFVNDEMITLSLGGDYSVEYNKPKDVPILYLSGLVAHLDADINYKDKWLFTLQTLYVAGMESDYTVNPVTMTYETTSIPAHFGVALEAEYVHSRALSFFAKLDNLAFHRYYLWANYPASRFNAMVGLTYTFPNK
ncbi:MAG: hypothetical protein J6X58_07270 [Bacteroidales bacterium]|nr:hypothetical protein [Bacteroidales bacterium]